MGRPQLKRVGMDRAPGLLTLYAGPICLAVVWGPGGFCISQTWLRRRTAPPAPRVRLVQG